MAKRRKGGSRGYGGTRRAGNGGSGWVWTMIVLAIVLLAAAITAGMTKGFTDWNPYGWFDKKTEAPKDDEQDKPEECAHEFENGVHVCIKCKQVIGHMYDEGSHECKICGELSAHEYEEGKHACKICGAVSEHEYAEGSHTCTICGEVSAHTYENGTCTVCGDVCEHEYDEGSHTCTICGAVSAHTFENGTCTVCGDVCTHEYDEGSHTCTICGEVSEHEYEEGSHTCTICGEVSEHEYVKGTNTHTCKVCGAMGPHTVFKPYVGAPGKHICECGYAEDHEYAEGSHECTVCGYVSEHTYTDGVCSRCGAHKITYTAAVDMTNFIAKNPDLFVTSAKAGEVVTLGSAEDMTIEYENGIKIRFEITSETAVERMLAEQDGYGSSTESITTSKTADGVWSFTVPEESGEIMVRVITTDYPTYPKGYHGVNFEDRSSGVSATGTWVVYETDGPSYVKEGELYMATFTYFDYTSGEGMTGTTPVVNDIDTSQSTGVEFAYAIYDGNSIIVFFRVADSENCKYGVDIRISVS